MSKTHSRPPLDSCRLGQTKQAMAHVPQRTKTIDETEAALGKERPSLNTLALKKGRGAEVEGHPLTKGKGLLNEAVEAAIAKGQHPNTHPWQKEGSVHQAEVVPLTCSQPTRHTACLPSTSIYYRCSMQIKKHVIHMLGTRKKKKHYAKATMNTTKRNTAWHNLLSALH